MMSDIRDAINISSNFRSSFAKISCKIYYERDIWRQSDVNPPNCMQNGRADSKNIASLANNATALRTRGLVFNKLKPERTKRQLKGKPGGFPWCSTLLWCRCSGSRRTLLWTDSGCRVWCLWSVDKKWSTACICTYTWMYAEFVQSTQLAWSCVIFNVKSFCICETFLCWCRWKGHTEGNAMTVKFFPRTRQTGPQLHLGVICVWQYGGECLTSWRECKTCLIGLPLASHRPVYLPWTWNTTPAITGSFLPMPLLNIPWNTIRIRKLPS